MLRRIRQLARGKFEYDKPSLIFSTNRLEFEVVEQTDHSGEFVFSSKGMPVRGVVYSTNARMECQTPQFEGEEIHIHFCFHSKGLVEGESQYGDFVILCNQRTYRLPFGVQITKLYMDSCRGKIKNLYDFGLLAKENWQEAYQLFYHKNFENVLGKPGSKEALLYKGFVLSKPCDQNLEEFLVSVGQKNPVHFSINSQPKEYLQVKEDQKETLELHKNHWGYLKIEASCDHQAIQLIKKEISGEDFIGSSYSFEFIIHANKLHAGNNYATITFTNGRETCELPLHLSRGSFVKNQVRKDLASNNVRLLTLYKEYRLKRIPTGTFVAQAIEILDHLHALRPDNPMYLLMKAQVLLIHQQNQAAEWILDEFKQDCVNRNQPLWGYYLYLMTLLQREPDYVNQMTKQIEALFREYPDSSLLFWVLLFLKEEYLSDNALKLKDLEYWIMKGAASPFFYIEAYYLYWQDPYLLGDLDAFSLRILRWAARNRAMTKDMAAQVFQILSHSKDYSPLIDQVVCAAYEADPKPIYIGTICSFLIRNQKFGPEFHHWYQKGIELELRITGLYEAFLLSMEEKELKSLPQIISMYFRYETNLPYKKLAVLYANIILQKDTCPEVYQNYRRAMGRFAMEQVELGHMDDNLAIIYQDMLDFGLISPELAKALSHVLFTTKLMVSADYVVRAIIYQKAIKDPQIVPVTDHVAYFNLYSKDYVIVFEDEKGRRYGSSVKCQLQSLMQISAYLPLCMDKAPLELPFLLAYFDQRPEVNYFVKEDQQYFERLLFCKELSAEYHASLDLEIMRFYRTSLENPLQMSYLEETDFTDFPAQVRRKMMELLVEHHFFAKAYDLVQVFGFDQIKASAKVALCCFMIKQYHMEEDDFLLDMVESAFVAGKYNDQMLAYLIRYYEGPTETMAKLWKAALSFELPCMDLEEKLLISMLYADNLLPEAEAVFEKYLSEKGREAIILAYLSHRMHAYFVEEEAIPEQLFELVEYRLENELDLNDACKLALLKFYSKKSELNAKEFDFEDQLLLEYTRRNMNFAFYKKLDRRLVMKYHFYDKVFLEYRTNPRCHVVLHYSRDEDGENFITEDMTDVYDGIFVKPFVMFFGEMIQYYISEDYKAKVTVTESNRIMNNDMYGEKDLSRYNLLNQMLISLALQDQPGIYHNMKLYAGFDEVTRQEFTLL